MINISKLKAESQVTKAAVSLNEEISAWIRNKIEKAGRENLPERKVKHRLSVVL